MSDRDRSRLCRIRVLRPTPTVRLVWYDSVTMFVFFLTVARYLEMRARHRSIDRSAALASLLPTIGDARIIGHLRDISRSEPT